MIAEAYDFYSLIARHLEKHFENIVLGDFLGIEVTDSELKARRPWLVKSRLPLRDAKKVTTASAVAVENLSLRNVLLMTRLHRFVRIAPSNFKWLITA